MGIFEAIVAAFEALLGNSAFVDNTHKLMTELGASASIPTLDAASATAETLLESGATVAATVDQVASQHALPPHHAAMVVASAAAKQKAAAPAPATK